MELLLGIDLGTTGCRSILYDRQLSTLGEDYTEYPLINLSERMIEQDAEQWWQLTLQSIRGALEKSGSDKNDLRGISVSSQGIAFVPVDASGHPLANAISWLDSRAAEEAAGIAQIFPPERLFHMTGKRANEMYVLPKLLWLKKHQPELYEKTYKFLMAHDYIVNRLCGAFVTDHTLASGTILYDIHRQDWSKELLSAFDIDRKRLPDIIWSGTVAGTLKKDIAGLLGLREDVAVAAGGQDQKCAALGAGIEDGIVTISLGTACAIERNYEEPFIDAQMRIPCFSGLFKNKWVAEGVVNTAAVTLRWLRDTLFPQSSYDELSGMAGSGLDSPGTLFFYPHLAGGGSPDWYSGAMGTYYGIRLNTRAEDFAAALFEGIAFQIKSNILVMSQTDANIREIRVFGGGAKSAVWCQVIADITGYPVKVPFTAETACAGAAIFAGIGSGAYQDADDARRYISIAKTYLPDEKRRAAYESKYTEYIRIEKRLWE